MFVIVISIYFLRIELSVEVANYYFRLEQKNNIMGLSPLFGVAKLLVRSRKLKMAAVGLQLAYLGYTYISDKRKNKQVQK